jgi:predicted nucleic acid-binding protein
MVLVDTSIWVSHLRIGDARLNALLQEEEVICHPFIVGELACGNIKNRTEVLTLLQALPMARMAKKEEVLRFIESHGLMGVGLGLIDVHLLASALLSKARLWTTDKPLREASVKLNVAYQ